MKVHDGVTSALILESGAVDVDEWYEAYVGKDSFTMASVPTPVEHE